MPEIVEAETMAIRNCKRNEQMRVVANQVWNFGNTMAVNRKRLSYFSRGQTFQTSVPQVTMAIRIFRGAACHVTQAPGLRR
jgi:hypothetical protein